MLEIHLEQVMLVDSYYGSYNPAGLKTKPITLISHLSCFELGYVYVCKFYLSFSMTCFCIKWMLGFSLSKSTSVTNKHIFNVNQDNFLVFWEFSAFLFLVHRKRAQAVTFYAKWFHNNIRYCEASLFMKQFYMCSHVFIYCTVNSSCAQYLQTALFLWRQEKSLIWSSKLR